MTAILSAAEVARVRVGAASWLAQPYWRVAEVHALLGGDLAALAASHEALRAERDAAQQRNDQSQREWLAMRGERDAAVATLRLLVHWGAVCTSADLCEDGCGAVPPDAFAARYGGMALDAVQAAVRAVLTAPDA